MTDSVQGEGAAALEAAAWFFENSLDVLVIVRDGCLQRVSPSWTPFLGWTEQESLGRSILEFIHADDVTRVRDEIAALKDGQRVTYELRLRSKSGEWRWTRVRGKRATNGASLIILEDLSPEHRRREQVRQTKHATDLMQSAAGVYMWRFNPQTGAWENSPDFSRPSEEAPTEGLMDVSELGAHVHPDDMPTVSAALNRVIRTGALGGVEYRHFHEGEERIVRAAWTGVRQLTSGLWEVIGVNQDLTELTQERDRAKAATLAKSRFLANISHEIRTPMNGVLGILHLLKQAHRESDRERLLDEAIASGSALSQLLGDIVTFSDADAGEVDIRPEVTDVDALIHGVCAMLRDQAVAKGLSFEVRTGGATWLAVDGAHLRQIVFNLISNAVKFTRAGQVIVRASTSGDGEGKRLLVEVEDSGVGIDAQSREDIFEPFHQLDGSATRQFGGAGLGLATARRLARLMDGDLTWENAAPSGSTFRLDIAAPAAAPMEAEAEGAGWLSGLRVLVVEDNATNRMIATRLLTQLGADVLTAEDGAQGAEAAAHEAFDLIFMDIQMPVLDGVQATRLIRSRPGPSQHAPIVAVTANVLREQVAGYRASGMNGCVAKPISPSALLLELSRIANDDEAPGQAAAGAA